MPGPRFLDPSSIPLKRQSGGNIWATLVRVTQAVTVVVVLSGLLLFFVPVLEKANRLQQEKETLQAKILSAQEEQQQFLLETDHMKNDPAYVEHIARDRLNMAHPGETIVRFDPYVATPGSAQTVTPTPENNNVSN